MRQQRVRMPMPQVAGARDSPLIRLACGVHRSRPVVDRRPSLRRSALRKLCTGSSQSDRAVRLSVTSMMRPLHDSTSLRFESVLSKTLSLG
jgi:hypothetical protein